jgi:superfamily II DNA helicase RecQ
MLRKTAIYVGEKTGCPVFLGKTTREEQKRLLQVWKMGKSSKERVIIATSAFGVGIPVPGVPHVIHVDGSYGLCQMLQETGRAGRDDGRAVSTTVMSRREFDSHARVNPLENKEAYSDFIRTKSSRHLIASRYVDQREDRCDPDWACDNCVMVQNVRKL